MVILFVLHARKVECPFADRSRPSLMTVPRQTFGNRCECESEMTIINHRRCDTLKNITLR